ncbi:MAG: hypothetical protein H7178_02455 [Chitinophagaceae bacterium]|nr:hypothetical protein [Chitinophagaceae bacterium]
MELDELKTQWQQESTSEQPHKSGAEISVLLTKKTASVIGKLSRNLVMEIIFCCLFILGFTYVALFNSHQSLRIYFSVFSIFCLLFLLVLFYLLKKIKRLSNTDFPIKQNLINIHSIIKEFTKRYFQFTMGLIPICVIFSGYLGYVDAGNSNPTQGFERFDALFHSQRKLIIFLITYLIVFSVGIYYFTKWYIKKLYGRYLVQLKGYIDELEE